MTGNRENLKCEVSLQLIQHLLTTMKVKCIKNICIYGMYNAYSVLNFVFYGNSFQVLQHLFQSRVWG